MAGHVAKPAVLPDATRWRESREYLRGLDLFNHGYYWEAHEAWEALWHAVGRGGLLGDFLKGLIKLAAAGVKAREGRPAGATRHARRAEALFLKTAKRMGAEPSAAEDRLMGFSLEELIAIARRLAENPPSVPLRDPVPPVEIIFNFRLLPE
jgi:predicted metal-dependent hydrolase